MPKIELRSEKVRVLIGAVPPSLIRYGNICLIILLMIMFILANIIKLPNNMECDVIAQEGSDQSLFLLVSCPKLMNKLILKGTSVSIYRGNMLITSGKLLENLEKVSLTGKKFEILLPIELLKEVNINDQILLSIEHGAELTVKIEMDNQTIVQSLFSKL